MKRTFIFIAIGVASLALLICFPLKPRQPVAEVPSVSLPESSRPPALPDTNSRSRSSVIKPPRTASRTNTEPLAKTVLQRIAQGDETVFKLAPGQVQAFLEKNRTNSESLLAAFNVTSDKEFLRVAAQRYPSNAFVLTTVLANDALPEQRRELIEQFKLVDPDNSLANYFSARDFSKSQQPDLALKEFSEASTKNGFHDFTVERLQGLEEIYLNSGYPASEAKALAMASLQIPALPALRELGREMSALQRQYTEAGDTTSAQSIARMGLALAANLTSASANSLLGQMIGSVVEREFLSNLDPKVAYDFISVAVNERLSQLQSRDKAIRDSAQFFGQWMQSANDAQLVGYFDRLKLYGESAALVWARAELARSQPGL